MFKVAKKKRITFTIFALFMSLFCEAAPSDLPSNLTQQLSAIVDVKDQFDIGSCWVHAMMTGLEIEAAKLGIRVTLSPEYLYAYYLRDQTVRIIQDARGSFNTKKVDPIEGGDFTTALVLAKTYGLVPSQEFHSRVPLSQWRKGGLFQALNNLIVRYWLNVRNFERPELRVTQGDYDKLYEEASTEALKTIEKFTGPLPKVFHFAEYTYTPPMFAEWIIPKRPHYTVHLVPPDHKAYGGFFVRSLKDFRGESGNRTALTTQDVTKILHELHVADTGVFVSIRWVKDFINKETGVMSLRGMSPKVAQALVTNSNYHAVQIVGYKLTPDHLGTVWKVQNSHGLNAGKKGYFYIYPDYFKAFFSSASFFMPEGHSCDNVLGFVRK